MDPDTAVHVRFQQGYIILGQPELGSAENIPNLHDSPISGRKTILQHMKAEDVPELTRISSKGQVVIPARVRERLGIKAGSVFAILTPRKGAVVVLKKIDSKAFKEDLEFFREVEKAWREVKRGQARRASRDRFVEELKTW